VLRIYDAVPASLGLDIRLVPIAINKGGCGYVCNVVTTPIVSRAIVLESLWPRSITVELVIDDINFAL
jgi:hypothetical protein